MSIIKLHPMEYTGYLEDLPKEISYHYQYQAIVSGKSIERPTGSGPSKGRITFPFLKSKDLSKDKRLVNMYNFPPSKMKTIYSQNLFNLPSHTHSRLSYMAGVELHYDEKGRASRYMNGTLYFYQDNFGYGILRENTKNRFYAFGCIKHQFENLTQEQCHEYKIQIALRYMVAVRRCSKCGFWEVLDSSG